jgi:hypothetical protein
MKPEFTSIGEAPGVRIRDPIENAQLELYTPSSVTPQSTSTDEFVFPVDAAVELRTSRIVIPRLENVYVHDSEGALVGQSSNHERVCFPDGQYSLDVSSGQMKLYLNVSSEVVVSYHEETTNLEFGEDVTVYVGARLPHEAPAGTITVRRDNFEDATRAVSLLGSALKTTTCERSFPTLRGHPPLVEVGDEFHVPEGIERPDTDVRIEVPRDFATLYQASSLAYYLGAEVVESDATRLVAGEFTYSFDSDDVETEFVRVLKQVFFFDCLTRTEGLYPVDLYEREAIADDLSLDFEALYEAEVGRQLKGYLSVPFETIEPFLPRWKLNADVNPRPENIEVLPFTANELGTVRTLTATEESTTRSEPEELTSFYRNTVDQGALVRSASATSDIDGDNIVKPRETDAIEHVWVSDGFPIGASKADADTYRRRLAREGEPPSHITIDIVVNDHEMSEEDVVQDYFGARDFFDFDVNVHYELTKTELAAVFEGGADFLHYVGHVDEDGFQCTDGMLDARTLDEVNVEAFLLNACRSYEQGNALVKKGSMGGIVTLSKVTNNPAVRMGRALARLLNQGFSLQSGLSVARHVTLFGQQYITIGDGTLQLVGNESGTPISVGIERANGDEFSVSITGYPTRILALGCMFTPHISDNTVRYLNSGLIGEFDVGYDTLQEFLELQVMPVLVDGDLYWSDELALEDL